MVGVHPEVRGGVSEASIGLKMLLQRYHHLLAAHIQVVPEMFFYTPL